MIVPIRSLHRMATTAVFVVLIWMTAGHGSCGVESFSTRATTLRLPKSPTTRSVPTSTTTTTLNVVTVDAMEPTIPQRASETTNTELKQSLFALLQVANDSNGRILQDSVLADPDTKEPLYITARAKQSRLVLGGTTRQRNNNAMVSFRLSADPTFSGVVYTGSSDSYLNLLTTPASSSDNNSNGSNNLVTGVILPMIPPPLRSALATAGVNVGSDYIPMRDLFTSPLVSYAYERGWRQGFASAGFPGPDIEARMALDYLTANGDDSVVVDMSCATGLFTRRLAASGQYRRVLGCDYSASMLSEARRRIQTASKTSNGAILELIQCDVGRIPTQTESVPALHAGAAMHCWPDLPRAVSEIHRVLTPNGGRYFATTFLSSYFGTLQRAEGGATGPSRQAFQYFASTEQLVDLLVQGGFDRDKVQVELLGRACVVIRCEK
jgi:ubiquinone/menaquinone biosynthesis C-methylase UbiE